MVTACIYLPFEKEASIIKRDLFNSIPQEWVKSEAGHNEGFFHHLKTSRGFLDQLYAVWKHNQCDYVGFSYNDVFLSLAGREYDKDIAKAGITQSDSRSFKWRENDLLSVIKVSENFIPRLYALEDISVVQDGDTIASFYKRKTGKDRSLKQLSELIKKAYPEFYASFDDVLNGKTLIPCNVFFLRRNLLNEYCEFLFGLLEKISFSSYQDEYVDYYLLSLILFTTYFTNGNIESLSFSAPAIYVSDYLRISNDLNSQNIVKSVLRKEKIIRYTSPKKVLYGGVINVVMSFDNRNGYAQHAYSVINSILAHTSNHKDINIFVIYGSDLPLSKINEISRNFSERVSVSFLKIDSCFLDNLELEDNYLTKSAYNRLLVQDVLPDNVHRIIYLDTDILVCDDIVELWNIDLHDHVIGAIPDIYSVGNDKRLFGRASDGLYINSGVMLLDLELAQKRYGRLSSYFAKVFYEHKDKVKYHDQDILNLAFHNKILQLPLRWNVPGLLYYFWPRLPKDLLDEENNDFPRDELIFSLNNPGIIHFIEDRKPWKRNCFNPFKRLYWRYRAQNIQFKPSIEQRFCIWNNVFTWRAGTFAVASGKKIHHIHARSKWFALKQTFKSMKF